MRYYPYGETRPIIGSVPNGGVLARQKFDAWGNVRGGLGAIPTDIGYTSQRSDATGLMYFKARYYAPSLGRFVSADTIVPEAASPQAFNRYAYSLNNPIKYIDPSGHSSKAIEDAAGLLGSGGGGPPTQPGDLERMAVTLIVGAAAFVGATYVAVTYGPVLVAGAETLAARVTTKLAEGVGACAVANCSDKAKQAVESVSRGCGGDCSDETEAAAHAAEAATKIATDANKLHHIFEKLGRGLEKLVEAFGSQEEAARAIQTEFSKVAGNYSIDQLKAGISVNVGGIDLIVRGTIVDDVARIGTVFLPK